jgi:hypothetical protein
MRHIWSLIAGLVAAPVVFFVLSLNLQYAQVRLTGDPSGFSLNFARLAVVGLILGVLATLKISPAGSVAAGVLLLIPSVIALVSLDVFLQIFEGRGFQLGIVSVEPLTAAASGISMVLGPLMLVAAASRRRWQNPAPAAEEPGPVATFEVAPAESADPAAVLTAAQLGQQWSPPAR